MAKASKTTGLSSSLKDRILKNTTIKETDTLDKSIFFGPKDMIRTSVPMLNVALSADTDGGMVPGILMIAGPSKHFKTGFSLMMAKGYLDKYEDGLIWFLDSEFGSPQSYFDAHGIPLDRVIHTPVTDIEQVKHEMMTQFKEFKKGDHVMIIMDSMGNLASAKEIEDALKGETKADFTRAKAFKSLFRMISPHLVLKGLPMIVINHSYKTIEMYSKDQVGGGTGGIYNSNDIWIIGREQDKDGTELNGFTFNIRIEKSRFVKEKSKFPITISFEKGMDRWSGLFDEALDASIIVHANKAHHFVLDGEDPDGDTMFKRKQVESDGVFWAKVFKETSLKEFLKQKYVLIQDRPIMDDSENVDLDTGEIS